MKKIIKRIFSFIQTNKSLILLVTFILIFLILLTVEAVGNYTNKIQLASNVTNCTFTEPMKTKEQLLKECEIQENTINDLINKCDYLELELNTYKEECAKYRKKNIDVNNMNPHSNSNLTVEELDKMLRGTGLESQGQAFKDMEETYNVNALFAMGVAMHESANGFKTANTYNYFGFRGNNGWMSFSSPYVCIQYFGKLIHNNYSNRNTISAIQSKYCPDGSPWTQRVITHMSKLKEVIEV